MQSSGQVEIKIKYQLYDCQVIIIYENASFIRISNCLKAQEGGHHNCTSNILSDFIETRNKRIGKTSYDLMLDMCVVPQLIGTPA